MDYKEFVFAIKDVRQYQTADWIARALKEALDSDTVQLLIERLNV